MFIGDLPRRNAYRYPNQTAIECDDRRLTWSEFNDSVNRLAHGLQGLRLRKGDRIRFAVRKEANATRERITEIWVLDDKARAPRAK